MFRSFATAVMASVLVLPVSVASAAETNMGPVILKLNGQVSLIGAVVDQSNMDGLDQGVLACQARLEHSPQPLG